MILIVDDDEVVRSSLGMMLRRAGYETAAASDPAEAMEAVRSGKPLRLAMLDMNFSRFTSGDEGLTLLRQIKLFRPDLPVILMTAWGSIDLAVEGMRLGAFDFVTKPWDNRRLLDRISNALSLAKGSNRCGFSAGSNAPGCISGSVSSGPLIRDSIIGEDPALEELLGMVARVAPTTAPVLITGESGTGKELIAEAIHRNSPRADRPFVKVNLGGLSASLFESEMFGHVKGAFTDAVADRIGRFQAADGGTIFLDEIGELDIASQVKLLRVLQEQKFEPLGSSKTISTDCRVICATNAPLPQMVADRTFREDLYYRISLVTLHLPPLRDRRADIPLLVRHFYREAVRNFNLPSPLPLTPAVERQLASLPWPGNIRELKNTVERSLLTGSWPQPTSTHDRGRGRLAPAGDLSQPSASPQITHDSVAAGPVSGATLPIPLLEKERIRRALADNHGNLSRASLDLGITRQALYRKMDKYGLR